VAPASVPASAAPADEASVVARFVSPGSGSGDLTVALRADPVRA
jgi:hypothetical protein